MEEGARQLTKLDVFRKYLRLSKEAKAKEDAAAGAGGGMATAMVAPVHSPPSYLLSSDDAASVGGGEEDEVQSAQEASGKLQRQVSGLLAERDGEAATAAAMAAAVGSPRGGGATPESEDPEALKSEILEHKRRALWLKREGRVPEAREALRKSKEVQARLDALVASLSG